MQRKLPVGPLALDFVEAVKHVLRDGIDVPGVRAIDEGLRPGSARQRNRAPVDLVTRERTPSVGDGSLVVTEAPVLVAPRNRDAERPVIVGRAENPRDFGRGRISKGRRLVEDALDAEIGDGFRIFQRARRANVDRRTDTAGGDAGSARLVDLDCGNGFRSKIGEVEST